MHGFESTDQVAETLKNLGEREEPFVVLLPRAAGQSAVRYRHTLYEPDEVNAFEAAPAAAPAAPRSVPRSDEDLAALRDEVAALRQRIESLEQKLQS
jgi:uncharacterized protein YceH (UPF0502 family)